MYGWRAKIGLITPMSENAEHAFHIYAPEGVSFASMKINFPGPTPEGLAILTDRLEETAAMYKDYDADLVHLRQLYQGVWLGSGVYPSDRAGQRPPGPHHQHRRAGGAESSGH